MSGPRGSVFRYREYAVDAERGVLTCRYELDGLHDCHDQQSADHRANGTE